MPRSSHSRRTPAKYSRGGRVDPALALHRLEQHGGHRRVEGSLEGVEVDPGHVAEPLGQRLERLVLGGLAGGVQRGERAAVEGAEGAHDDVAAPPTELAGQLDGALVGLGAGVGEEDLAAPSAASRGGAEQAVEGGGDLRTDRGAEEVRHVQQGGGLLGDGLGDGRMAVTEARDGEPGEEVEVLLAVAVPHPGARAPDELDRRRRVGRHQRAGRRRSRRGPRDHRADAGVAEQLEQHDVGQATVEEVGRADAVAAPRGGRPRSSGSSRR